MSKYVRFASPQISRAPNSIREELVSQRLRRYTIISDYDSDTDSELCDYDTLSIRVIKRNVFDTSFSSRAFRKPSSYNMPYSSPASHVHPSEFIVCESLKVPPASYFTFAIRVYISDSKVNDFHSLFVNNSNDVTFFHSSVIYGEWVSFNCLGDTPRFVYDPGGIAATYLSGVIGC
jgi:hypothetical protein